MQQDSKPPIKKEEIPANPDNKIDQDFPGFPHGEATEKKISPTTEDEKKTAQVNIKDGEKVNKNDDKEALDEEGSDGSGTAFDATENVADDDYDNSREGK